MSCAHTHAHGGCGCVRTKTFNGVLEAKCFVNMRNEKGTEGAGVAPMEKDFNEVHGEGPTEILEKF